jgi:hypothetical protein
VEADLMTKRINTVLRVIELLDAKIEGLRAAKELLLEQQRTPAAPKAVKAPAAVTTKVG